VDALMTVIINSDDSDGDPAYLGNLWREDTEE
jgi:hypothetical protein